MTFREYISECDFEAVWPYLNRHFKEKKAAMPLYKSLYDSIRALPVTDTDKAITMTQFSDGDWELTNIIDPHEELIDRDVQVHAYGRRKKPWDEVIAAHLLFWSSMYGFETSAQYQESFGEWLDDISQGPYYELDTNSMECSKHICKWLFFAPSMSLFNKEETAAWDDPDKGKENMVISMMRVLSESGIAEISRRTHAEIMVFLPEEWKELYPELEDVIADLPLKTRLTQWLYKTDAVNDMIGKCHLAKYRPYVIMAEGDSFDDRHKDFIHHPEADGRMGHDTIEKAVASLNRFDNYNNLDFYPDRKARRKEAQPFSKITEESLRNKRRHYWSRAVQNDYTYDWSANLLILKKKLEYNIGYWKYVQRHVGWDEDVRRMQLACRLIDISTTDYELTFDSVNERNAYRYGIEMNEYGDEDAMIDMQREELYKAKAYRLLWRLLDRNMKKWWD